MAIKVHIFLIGAFESTNISTKLSFIFQAHLLDVVTIMHAVFRKYIKMFSDSFKMAEINVQHSLTFLFRRYSFTSKAAHTQIFSTSSNSEEIPCKLSRKFRDDILMTFQYFPGMPSAVAHGGMQF